MGVQGSDNRGQRSEDRKQRTENRAFDRMSEAVECWLLDGAESDLTSNSVFPMTLMLLRSMADTATSGVSRPLTAMGILIRLYTNVKTRF